MCTVEPFAWLRSWPMRMPRRYYIVSDMCRPPKRRDHMHRDYDNPRRKQTMISQGVFDTPHVGVVVTETSSRVAGRRPPRQSGRHGAQGRTPTSLLCCGFLVFLGKARCHAAGDIHGVVDGRVQCGLEGASDGEVLRARRENGNSTGSTGAIRREIV